IAGIFLISRLRPGIAALAMAFLVAFLTGLKVYPAAAVVILLRNRKALWTVALTAVGAVGALLLAGGRHLFLALSNTPQLSKGAFGSYPFFIELGHSAFPFLVKPVNAHHVLASIGALILFVGSAAWAILSRDRIASILPPIDFAQPRGLITLSCLAIFCLAFVAGANFFYRLIFLLGVLAYLIEDLNKGTSWRSLAAGITIVLFLWMPGRFIMMHELLDGLAFVGASAWLSSTLWKCLMGEHSTANDAVPLLVR
ncbi:MAG TPA: hypothetical protein VFR08_15495, partial [Candidatus Angelobacter sp.]|nr:hypothetical protein [Candidatus Angelobacter sp.]